MRRYFKGQIRANSMRIAFIIDYFPNTSETFVLNQITGLLDRGHEVFIYPFRKNTQRVEHNIWKRHNLSDRTYYRSTGKTKLIRMFISLGKLIMQAPFHPLRMIDALNIFRYGRSALNLTMLHEFLFWPRQHRTDFDIIYCHFGPHGNIATELRRRGYISGKLVTVFHAHDLTRYVLSHGRNVYTELFSEGDLFMAISSYAKLKLRNLGCPESKIIIHHMGVDCNYFAHKKRDITTNETLNVVTIGRMVEKKGFVFAIQAIAKAITQNYEICCTFVGDGPLRTDLERLVRSLGLEKHFEFTGWRTKDQIAKIIGRSDVMLVPSITAKDGDEEGLPVVLMEALATGLPVIATNYAGIPELIEDGKTGFLVAERDIETMAEKIHLLAVDTNIYRELSVQGREKIEQEFDIDKLNDRLVEIFTELLSN